MIPKKNVQQSSGPSIFSIISYKYLPYWPLFALLSAALLFVAYIYTRFQTPMYSASATIVINDKEKGAEESEMVRSLNVYATNKTVENEVEILQSRSLLNSVVNRLHLYAPLFEKGRVKPGPAYLTSPIVVLAREPDQLKPQKEIAFEYDNKAERVKIGDRYYPLGQWITFPYGVLRFEKNPEQKHFSPRPMYFSLLDTRIVASGIGSRLEVGPGSKLSSIINIEYTDELPERAEDIVNALLEVYNQASIQHNSQLAANTLAFVSTRVRDLERELDSIERRIQQYRTTNGVVDISQQGRIYLESVAENDRRVAEINTQLAVLEQVERFVQSGSNRTGIVPTTLGIDDPVLADLLRRLNELELEYTNRRTRIGENNPMVESIENEISKIRPNIMNIVRNQRARLQATVNNYNQSTQEVTSGLRSLPLRERELLEISRQQAIKRDVYSFLLQRREEAELSNASTISDSRVIDRAQASVSPVSSKSKIIMAGALIAALALSIGYVFFREGMSSQVLFRSDITKKTTLPIIGEIALRKRRKGALAQLAGDPVLVAQFRQLQVAMGLFDGPISRNRILVTSGIANEGKTFISNLLAISLAQAGKRVLLMDLNFHAPETSELNDAQGAKGISNYILGETALRELVQTTRFPGLYLLPAGTRRDNAAALLLNKQVDDLMGEVAAQFDFVVMDTPPIEVTTDAYLLARHCNSSLFIIRQGKTPNTLLQKLDTKQKLHSLPQLGLVFNGIKARGFLRKYYGYGYGYGHENVFTAKAYRGAE